MPDRRCSTGKARFATSDAARARLQQIIDNPRPNQLYMPCNVVSCDLCDGYHLTSRTGKRWKKGKLSRDRRVPRR